MFAPTTAARSASLAARRAHRGPIVLAVGGRDPGSVLDVAGWLTQRVATERGVLALSVLEPLPVYVPGADLGLIPPGFDEERRSTLLRGLTESLERSLGVHSPWAARVLFGYPGYAIADVAREQDATLIVMGIGQHRLVDRLFGAETALRTIRRASCPVLALAPGFLPPPRVVVAATDFSAQSAAAAEAALPLLGEDATLHVVHAWRRSEVIDARLQAVDEAYARGLPERFRRFAAALDIPPGVMVTYEALEGTAAAQVVEFAQARHADLVVAGRHGLGMLQRAILGSVTTALLRSATCSLLVAPEPPFAEVDRLQRLLSGTSESVTPEQWRVQLDEFTRRNRGRRTAIEIDDPALGAQAQESGYALLGATYDPHDRRVELMLGDAGRGARHLTRGIEDVKAVAVVTDAQGTDVGLRVRHGEGQTLLTFLPV